MHKEIESAIKWYEQNGIPNYRRGLIISNSLFDELAIDPVVPTNIDYYKPFNIYGLSVVVRPGWPGRSTINIKPKKI